MGKVYAVTSGKGGVGKSTTSVGLATAFTALDKRVLLIDMDEGLRCLDVMLGIDESVVFDLSDILAGKELDDTVYQAPKNEKLHLIPAPSKLGTIDADLLEKFALKVKKLYDIVIFDFPAGIDFTLYSRLPKGTLFLTVALPDPVTLRDAAIVSDKLDEIGAESKLVLNCFDYKLTKQKIYSSIDDIIDKSGLCLLGIIPKAKELSLLSINNKLKFKGNSMKAFTRIAKRLNGEHVLLPKLKKI